jgi:hypothetical protein
VSDVRIHYTGEFWSVQVHSPARAPGSGWYEVARFDEQRPAECLKIWLDAPPCLDAVDAEVIGDALAKARSIAHAYGVVAGIASEKKRAAAEVGRG